MKRMLLLAVFVWSLACSLHALEPGPDDVLVRVVDVGAGLCCVVKMPPAPNENRTHYMIYDAGHWEGISRTVEAIEEMIPRESIIDLMVLSHSDSDHLGAVKQICDAYTVRRVIHSGMRRDSNTWERANTAILQEKRDEGCVDINLNYFEFPPGATYRFGNSFVTMVRGFCTPPEDWGELSSSEYRNAGSVVIRLVLSGSSVLFCGDSVGRHIGDPTSTCIATEKFMIRMSPVIPIDSDIVIAPHHGADNASSVDFVRAVSPKYVIFSAGHDYDHPTAAAAGRYLDCGVDVKNIFRTDLDDDESGDDSADEQEDPHRHEWAQGRTPGLFDRRGDDDIDILLRADASFAVAYHSAD